MVESVFGFCTQIEYDNFMKGVKGFEKDLVRQGTIMEAQRAKSGKFMVKRRFNGKREERRGNSEGRSKRSSQKKAFKSRESVCKNREN
jgi:polyphosphate kinase 2 (PPK2 family)